MQNLKRKPIMAVLVMAFSVAVFAAMNDAAAEAVGPEEEVENFPTVLRQGVELWSDGTRLAGDLYYPKERTEGEKLPAIVLCHGWGGTKAHLGRAIAPGFAAEGYAVLTFDYRGWGESDSRLVVRGEMPEPDEDGNVMVKAQAIRELVDPVDQQMDIDAAFSYIEGEAMVDAKRIGIWGSSFGGGHVVWRTAHDDRVACAVAQVGGVGGNKRARLSARLRKIRSERARGVIDPVPQGIPMPGGELRGTAYFERIALFSAGYYVGEITVPFLQIDAEKEHYFNIEQSRKTLHEVLKKNGVPTEYHVIEGMGHYDVYSGDALKKVMALEIAWFNKHLKQ